MPCHYERQPCHYGRQKPHPPAAVHRQFAPRNDAAPPRTSWVLRPASSALWRGVGCPSYPYGFTVRAPRESLQTRRSWISAQWRVINLPEVQLVQRAFIVKAQPDENGDAVRVDVLRLRKSATETTTCRRLSDKRDASHPAIGHVLDEICTYFLAKGGRRAFKQRSNYRLLIQSHRPGTRRA